MGKKCVTRFVCLIVILVYSGQAFGISAGDCCVSDSGHTEVEFAHDNTVAAPSSEIQGAGSKASLTSPSEDCSHRHCTASSLDFSHRHCTASSHLDTAPTANVTSSRSDSSRIIASANGLSHWLSGSDLVELYFTPLPCSPSSKTSTSSSIRATVLLI